jgi:DNA-directed RNA polymerase specialized sigma24 family protein
MANAKSLASGIITGTDMVDFLDFQTRWDDGTLTDDHPVVVTASKWARAIASSFNCLERADDLKQKALFSLRSSSYRGESTLDAYIKRILVNSNTAEWRKGGGKKRGVLPAEMVDTKASELFETVLRRISSDKLMNELLTTRPEVQRAIVMIVISAEEQVGRRRLAAIASRMLGRKVTRYEVEVALTQLREAFTRPSSYHQASAG